MLGPSSGHYYSEYDLKEGHLYIEYSSGPCRADRNGGWNVPENVVVSIHFSPAHKQKVSDLKLDLQKYRKVIDQHVEGVVYYVNDEDGISYETQKGKVEAIDYDPPKRFENLQCDDSRKKD
jgi:hypothetical protein